MKLVFKAFMAAAVIIFAGCQKQELLENPQSETAKATLTASIGDPTKVGIAEDVAGLKVTWSAGDKIGLYDENGNYACVFVLKAGEEGKTKADFEKESGDFDASKTYTVVYPHIENVADLTAYAAAKTTRLAADQTQDGATLDHLGELCFMEGTNTESTISFTHTISILTIKLEKPVTADAAEVLESISFTNGTKSYNLNITNGDWTKAAYMIIGPIADPARNLSFDVTTDADNLYMFRAQTGKEYEAGKRYNADLTGGKLIKASLMKFTIDTRKYNATDATFVVPFPTGTISGYGFIILWGDGSRKAYPDGTNLTQALLTHTYATPGQYQIIIQSTQTNTTAKQIPVINFYSNYNSISGNPSKLISMDTPILNTKATSFVNLFTNCSNLTSISNNLFDNNIDVTNFNSCFASCNSLTAIPSGLFDKNITATDFSACFLACNSLTAIPSGLFDKNIAVTNFGGCFQGCSGITMIPDNLFDQNTAVTNFNNCFFGCSRISSIPSGLFDKNTMVEDFASCFASCMNLASIPGGLFDNNTKVTKFASCFSTCRGLLTIQDRLFSKNINVTDFNSCFKDCTKLQLNPNIFCDEATEKTIRFASKTVNFSNCFYRSLFTGIAGQAPALWEYAGTLNGTDCFKGSGNNNTSITNYYYILKAWGGPK